MNYIKWFDQVRLEDIALVGGKNASIGQMIGELAGKGIRVPMGFAITAPAYWYYLESNKLVATMRDILAQVSVDDLSAVQGAGSKIRTLILNGQTPQDLQDEIVRAYSELAKMYQKETVDVAVRSSATAEDLPTASFAGQQETYLNICNPEDLLESCKKSFASLFTDRAIVYRGEQGFDHFKVALSIGIQKMVRSDVGCAGVAFSLDTESGFADVVTINASYGLGETIVKGMVIPDEYVVHKPTLEQGFAPIIKKYCGQKQIKIVYGDNDSVKTVPVPVEQQRTFALSDEEILSLARSVIIIEQHYSCLAGHWKPMDIEWAKDGTDGMMYIVQARPETIHGVKIQTTFDQFSIDKTSNKLTVVATGKSIGQKIVTGPARVIKHIDEINTIKKGDILVTEMTDPDWVPALKITAGIITNRGGRTCHAAIVSRELGVPALVGAQNATEQIKDGQLITLDCSQGDTGYVYDGAVSFSKKTVTFEATPCVPVDIMVNLADPDSAFKTGMLPVAGVGLARIEFIITNLVKIHPMAILHPELVTDTAVFEAIEQLTPAYSDKKQYFVQTLAQGVGMIAAGFYPRPVIVRLSDFKTNEYRNLIGGSFFEPKEENPMLGFRGAFRYYHERYQEGFALECQALKMVREQMGLKNIKVMVPFVRTVNEARHVVNALAEHGLKRGQDGLELVMMCEIPSNVILMDAFCEYFDGFSIGSNDLTQLVLGVDRDSQLLAAAFDERDEAVLQMMKMAIAHAHRHDKYIGICGQAPSDYPEIAEFLIDEGIDSISLSPDSVLPFFHALYMKLRLCEFAFYVAYFELLLLRNAGAL